MGDAFENEIDAAAVVQLIKNLHARQKTWVQFLGWKDPLRRERLPTPVFWPGESYRLYSPWDHKELDTTERLSLTHPGTIGRWRPGVCYKKSNWVHVHNYLWKYLLLSS